MKKINKAVIAIDSFKGSLSTFESAEAVTEALTEVFPGIEIDAFPLADGGEGTMEALVSALGGMCVSLKVCDPLCDTVYANYGFTREGVAVIEMASASGITLIPKEKRNPMYTTSFGTGELIRHAILKGGCRKFIIGIGGSATNDGGVGMLTALGFEFLDENGDQIPLGGGGLLSLKKIKTDNVLPELSECEFLVACDVTNPLCGENGASCVYGPQKGATAEIIERLDKALLNYAHLTREIFPDADENYPGSGAAGGLGFALHTYLHAELKSGIDLVMDTMGIREAIKECDLVITGEGRLDSQSAMGKAPIGIAKEAKIHGKPVIAFSGCVADGAEKCNEAGIDAYFPILRRPVSLSEAMGVENAYKNLRDTAVQAFRLVGAVIDADR